MFGTSSEHSPYQYSSLDEGRRRTPLTAIAACALLVIVAGVLAYIVYAQKNVLSGFNNQLEQANAQTAQAKSDLAKVAASEADLRLQLDKAQSARAEVEAEAAKARGAGSDLQTELAKAQSAKSELQAQLDRTKADMRSLQSQMEGLQSESAHNAGQSTGQSEELAQLKSQRDALKEQLARSQEEMAKLQAQVPVAHPPLPLTVSFKKGFLSSKFEMRVKNQASDPLNLEIAVIDSARTLSKSATIKPGKTLELGKLTAGGDVTIASEGFDPIHLVVQK